MTERVIEPFLLKPTEAAKLLAIGDRTLWRLTARKAIKAIKIGRAVRYRVEELHAFIERQRDACI